MALFSEIIPKASSETQEISQTVFPRKSFLNFSKHFSIFPPGVYPGNSSGIIPGFFLENPPGVPSRISSGIISDFFRKHSCKKYLMDCSPKFFSGIPLGSYLGFFQWFFQKFLYKLLQKSLQACFQKFTRISLEVYSGISPENFTSIQSNQFYK